MGRWLRSQNLDDAGRSARREAGLAALQAACVDGMEAVDVLVGSDCLEETLGVDVLRQRKLDEDAVDVVAGVELGDEGEHLVGGDALGRRDHLAEDAELAAGLYLAANVDLRGGNLADKD